MESYTVCRQHALRKLEGSFAGVFPIFGIASRFLKTNSTAKTKIFEEFSRVSRKDSENPKVAGIPSSMGTWWNVAFRLIASNSTNHYSFPCSNCPQGQNTLEGGCHLLSISGGANVGSLGKWESDEVFRHQSWWKCVALSNNWRTWLSGVMEDEELRPFESVDRPNFIYYF